MFTIRWDKINPRPPVKRKLNNYITVKVTCLNAKGEPFEYERQYEEWMGVCTNKIQNVVKKMKLYFPGCHVRCQRLGQQTFKKVLPYFEQRLQSGKLDYASKSFYKVYSDLPLEDVGNFFDKYKIAYYEKSNWLNRIYIDMCHRYNTGAFYYKWYDIGEKTNLMDSFRMIPEKTDYPDWTIASFDIETVPLSGENRVPTGADSKDVIVMISVVKWNRLQVSHHLVFWSPCSIEPPVSPSSFRYDENVIQYNAIKVDNEIELLIQFHALIEDAHVLTGYNINKFDIPCIFSRLWWLGMTRYLQHYSSKKIGDYIVATFKNKLVIDMFHYFNIFSNYDLPSFKLDDVAKAKLGKSKLPLKSTGIHTWYTSKKVVPSMWYSRDVKKCFDILKPSKMSEDQFATPIMYMEYCLVDAFLVKELFVFEKVLSFLVERANFSAKGADYALHLGNSTNLLEMMTSYGTFLGYFININHFKNLTDTTKYKSMFIKGNGKEGKDGTYQGALNYCIPKSYYKDVSVMDFVSMYPSSLLSANLCYGTSTILTKDEYLNSPLAQTLTAIPFRNHSEKDFQKDDSIMTDTFSYPPFDPNKDKFVIVVNQKTKAFLPELVLHFLNLRKFHQREWKQTKNVYHYNSQLNIKILINSLYGVMGSKDSPLAKLTIAMSIVALARYQLLGSYQYIVRKGYNVCYADTDSLMVHNWPFDNCDEVNRYLNIPHVEIKYEERFKRLLVLSKKRYVYENQNDKLVTKGFQKKINDLLKFMSDNILRHAMKHLLLEQCDFSLGWIIWVETLTEAYYRCRNPKKYSITRKTKNLEEYKSTTCSTVRMLQKYPEKAGEYIEYTYSRADVSAKEETKWIMDVDDVQYLNFEQLFKDQKKIFIDLLNVSFWNLPNPYAPCQKILNTMRWKCFMHSELLQWFQTKERIIMFVERGIKYTFEINNHLFLEKAKLVVK